MRGAYFEQLIQEGAAIDRDLFDQSVGYVDWLLGVEVAGAAHGEVAQQKARLVRDSQVWEALLENMPPYWMPMAPMCDD